MTPREAGGAPDVSHLAREPLPEAPFPGGKNQAFRIFLAPEVHAAIWSHAGESTSVEICGVLVGSWHRDADGPFVHISASIRGEAAASKFAEVTFTHETWAKINQEMDSRYADQAIVGWYHSHPDFGVFLSDRDVFIQQHFFSGAGQVAYVVDPIRRSEGAFIWTRGKPKLASVVWVGDQLQTAEAAATDAVRRPVSTGTDAAASAATQAPRIGFDRLTTILALVAVFLLGYLLASRLRQADDEKVVRDAIAHASLMLGVKPGLRESLEQCLRDLATAEEVTASLEKELPQPEPVASDDDSEGDDEGQTPGPTWSELQSRLAVVRQRLRGVQSEFCLTPEETDSLLHSAAVLLAYNRSGLTDSERRGLALEIERLMVRSLAAAAQAIGDEEIDNSEADDSPEAEAPEDAATDEGKE